MTKKLLNPRGYLSWTQVDMWERSPERYIRQYIHGAAEFKNNRMDFGSKVALAEETGEETDDETINALVALLPKLPKREHTIRATLKTPHGEVDLLGKFDKFDDVALAIRDTKTGTTKWTQTMANKHRQLRHYAALVYLFHGRLPSEMWIDWAQTEEVDGEIRLTGLIKSFRVVLQLRDVLEYLADVSRVAREIDEAYRREIDKLA